MNMTVKIIKTGNSAGIVLPKAMLAHLDAQVGELLTVAKSPTGFELRPADSDFDAQLAVTFVDLAAGELTEAELATWFREYCAEAA